MKNRTKWLLISGAVALGGASFWALTHPFKAALGLAVLGGGAFVYTKVKDKLDRVLPPEESEADKTAAAPRATARS